MDKLRTYDEIRKRAHEIILQKGGMKYADLKAQILTEYPETSPHSVSSATFNLDKIYPADITKPGRGIFAPIRSIEAGAVEAAQTEETAPSGLKLREADFYDPFAEWLKDD